MEAHTGVVMEKGQLIGLGNWRYDGPIAGSPGLHWVLANGCTGIVSDVELAEYAENPI
jgi:hypothetical protein